MKNRRKGVTHFLLLIMLLLPGSPAMAADTQDRVKLGVIWWDGSWKKDNIWQKNLNSPQWHSRLAFFAEELSLNKVRMEDESQELIDRQILYAKEAFDYLAFYYLYEDPKFPNYGLRYYLSSKHKSNINFCLILSGEIPYKDMPEAIKNIVGWLKDPSYQKVVGGRPLVYWMHSPGPEDPNAEFWTKEKLHFNFLLSEILKAGLPRPYFVAQMWDATQAARYADVVGLDAIGCYAVPGTGQNHEEHPYADLAQGAYNFWEAAKETGKKVVLPTIAGWDGRPRLTMPGVGSGYDGDIAQVYKESAWYKRPTPEELAAHVKKAIQWSKKNPGPAEAKTVLLYAWNEVDEGGYVVPTKSEGDAHLKALKEMRMKN